MLRATFPPIKCKNGHIHAYTDAECPQCHEPVEIPKITNQQFCECGMIRPAIVQMEESRMVVHDSKFCFWCGKYFEETTKDKLFFY